MPYSTLTTSSSHQHIHYAKKNRLKSLIKLEGIFPPPSTNIKFHLVEPILFLRGIPQESVGCFLRGKLILNLNKPTKIKKIEMKFVGKIKTFWPEGKIYTGPGSHGNELCEEHEVISHNWTFLSSPRGSNSRFFSSGSSFQLLDAGAHIYDFELYLPGNLPETINADRGKVSYKLVARAIRSGLQPNIKASQDVPIIRTIFDERNAEGIVYANDWRKTLGYEINLSKKAYMLGEPMQIDLKFSPLIQDIQIIGIQLKIHEESTYKSNGQKVTESQTFDAFHCRIDDPDISKSIDEDGKIYCHIMPRMPECTGPIHYSCKSSGIIITHKLRFLFTVMTPVADSSKGKKNKFEVNMPVTILSCICADDLPTYDEGEFINGSLLQYGNDLITFTAIRSQQDLFLRDLPPNYENLLK
ncbi:2681_t:CDS:2 [Cetraspora pellucida]|uniref:2681_t:CDS:1 n=1 Tax=Cetraspora pellucida TaxID=1433469 RepID=A0A9N9BLG2_9GLOM|nr:2681_t:CDS:2 [Cetraspora pellucida]